MQMCMYSPVNCCIESITHNASHGVESKETNLVAPVGVEC